MPWLKQSTAVDIGIGPFLDATDGNTPETALTITAPDIRLKKNGGAFAQKNAAQTLTHEEAGWYEVSLDTTDTNTLGILIVAIHESGALPVWKEYMVVPANTYDSLVSGSDFIDTNVAQWNGTTIPAVHTAGYPIVTIKDGTGTGEIDTASGKVLLANGVHGGAAATLTLKQAEINNQVAGSALILTSLDAHGLEINSAGDDAVRIASTGGNGDGIDLRPNGTGVGIRGSITGALVGNITGNLSGSVGSVTATVNANVTQVSGDSTAADNLETMLDGTGGQTLTLKSVVVNNGAGIGLSVTGSTKGVQLVGGTDAGLVLSGLYGLWSSGSSAGIRADATAGPGFECASAGTSPGALFTGTNSGAGIKAVGGSTGAGLEVIGGSTSGIGFKATGVAGFAGMSATGGVTGRGFEVLGGGTSGTAMHVQANGSNSAGLVVAGDGSGADIDAAITGNITGNLSGSAGSVTAVSAGAITTTSFAAGAIDAAAIAANAIGASELATDAVSEIVAGLGGVGAFAITVTVNDGAAALQNVAVSIADGGGAIAGSGTTNASGQASFSLAAGTYTVALVKSNYNFAPVSRTVTGNQAGSIVTTMSMTIITAIPASGTPGICVVAGYIKDLNGNALVGSLVKARLVPATANRPITSDGVVLGLEADTALTNGIGYVSFELIRTDEIDQPCTYTFKCEDAQMEKRNVLLAAATLDIATL